MVASASGNITIVRNRTQAVPSPSSYIKLKLSVSHVLPDDSEPTPIEFDTLQSEPFVGDIAIYDLPYLPKGRELWLEGTYIGEWIGRVDGPALIYPSKDPFEWKNPFTVQEDGVITLNLICQIDAIF